MNKPRTIYLDDATWEGLRKQAFERRVTVSSIIREAVTKQRGVLVPPTAPPRGETPVSDRPSGVQSMSQAERDAVLRKLSK